MYDIIIIGAGPSGLTSAIYALRANKKVKVLESKCYGGQIINASCILNYPGIKSISGFDYATVLFEQASAMGMEFEVEEVIKIEKGKVFTKSNTYLTKSIIIATGCTNKKLGFEDKFIGRGVSYCATCDGNFYKNKKVAVVGGGNTALEDALYLSDIAEYVYLIHRRDTFKGEERYVDELNKRSNVEVILDSNVTSINGDSVIDSITINNDKKILVDGLFIAIGQTPNSSIFKGLIDMDSYGYILSDGVVTNIDSIYVAGDVRKKELRQLTTAVSDGALAASMAISEVD